MQHFPETYSPNYLSLIGLPFSRVKLFSDLFIFVIYDNCEIRDSLFYEIWRFADVISKIKDYRNLL